MSGRDLSAAVVMNRNGEPSRKRYPTRPYVPMETWEVFDELASRMVRKEITFETFANEVKRDVERMAYAAIRRRPLTAWMGLEDVKSYLFQYLWYYAFVHVCRSGVVGYDAAKHPSAGAYLRWNAMQHVQKDLGKARGENMNTHRLMGPPPETLTSTGDVTIYESNESGMEVELDDVRKRKALAKLREATKNFVVQNELLKVKEAPSKKSKVVSFFMEQPRKVKEVIGMKTTRDAEKVYSFLFKFSETAGAELGFEAETSSEKGPSLGAHREE